MRFVRFAAAPSSSDLAASPLACAALALALALSLTGAARAEGGFLQGIKRQTKIASTVPESGDQNPYAVVVVPETAGRLVRGHVLVTNFNNGKNLQGTGTTLMQIDPAQGDAAIFAAVPQGLAGCPGGVGLSTALAVLPGGWVLVGSAPSTDGTTATRGDGCLILLDNQGKPAGTIAGPDMSMPWGNMAVRASAGNAAIFLSNAGFGIGSPKGEPPVLHRATILRLDFALSPDAPPKLTGRTVVANGLPAQADESVFLVGPTGLALAPDGTLYASNAIDNSIIAIPDALTRKDSAGTGKEIAKGGLLKRPLAMVLVPGGNLLVTNGLNGQVVEIAPDGRQIAARWVDANRAQTPPGSGDLFGLAMTEDGMGFYYVEDENNTLVLAR
jgi:hypothetical protein